MSLVPSARRGLARALVGLLPSGRLKNTLLNRLCGDVVHPTAVIKPCVLLGLSHFEVGPQAVILHGNVIRGVDHLVLNEGAYIGRFNYIASDPTLAAGGPSGTAGRLLLEQNASLAGRHRLDCSGGVRIGAFATLAGWGTSIITHGIDTTRNVQNVGSVTIGAYCLVGAQCIVLSNAHVAPRVVVGAGSVIARPLEKSDSLYAGVPAIWRKGIEGDAYFTRRRRFVDPATPA